jgi:hypothetical protein
MQVAGPRRAYRLSQTEVPQVKEQKLLRRVSRRRKPVRRPKDFAPCVLVTDREPPRFPDECVRFLLFTGREHHRSLGCQQSERERFLEVQFDDGLGMAQVADRNVLTDI